jgi:hypothetical protein
MRAEFVVVVSIVVKQLCRARDIMIDMANKSCCCCCLLERKKIKEVLDSWTRVKECG